MKRGFLNSTKAKKQLDVSIPSSTSNPASDKKIKMPEIERIAYGKVPNAGRPEGYVAKDSAFEERRSDTDYDDPFRAIQTTIPPRSLDLSEAELNTEQVIYTECYIDPPTKKYIRTQPGFPHPVAIPHKEGYYRIAPSNLGEKAGLGAFAEKNFAAGELIISERPLVITPAAVGIGVNITNMPKHFTKQQTHQALLFEYEKVLQSLVNRMLPKNRESLMSLANCHTEDGSGPINGVIRTNGLYPDGLKFFENMKDWHTDAMHYSVVCKDFSRINHSCAPNMSYYFDHGSFSFHGFAIRPIKKDEELFITYGNLLTIASSRETWLAPYGILKCSCKPCSPSHRAQSDMHRMMILQQCAAHGLKSIAALASPKSQADMSNATRDQWIKWMITQIDLIEGESLQGCGYEGTSLYATYLATLATLLKKKKTKLSLMETRKLKEAMEKFETVGKLLLRRKFKLYFGPKELVVELVVIKVHPDSHSK